MRFNSKRWQLDLGWRNSAGLIAISYECRKKEGYAPVLWTLHLFVRPDQWQWGYHYEDWEYDCMSSRTIGAGLLFMFAIY